MSAKLSLAAYSFSHFCVDFSCFYILFAGFAANTKNIETLAVGFLIYNIIAFGLQPIIGYLCDEKKKIPIGAIGCAILFLSLCLIRLPAAALALCALGNACFHIGGGIDSLAHAAGKWQEAVFLFPLARSASRWVRCAEKARFPFPSRRVLLPRPLY